MTDEKKTSKEGAATATTPEEQAKATMRKHLWMAEGGTVAIFALEDPVHGARLLGDFVVMAVGADRARVFETGSRVARQILRRDRPGPAIEAAVERIEHARADDRLVAVEGHRPPPGDELVVVDRDCEPVVAAVGGEATRHGPGPEHAVLLQPQVEVVLGTGVLMERGLLR